MLFHKVYDLATAVYPDIVVQGSCLGHTQVRHIIGLAHAKHLLNGPEGEQAAQPAASVYPKQQSGKYACSCVLCMCA